MSTARTSEQVLDYPKQQDHMRRFAELCAYINNHCTERLSVEDLASRAGFSVYHFSRLFKENTGMTCHNYLVARRIIYAKALLVDDTIPITEIAMQVGLQLDRNLQPPVQGADRLYPYRVPPDGLPRDKKAPPRESSTRPAHFLIIRKFCGRGHRRCPFCGRSRC